jgi:hypothetical protein
VLQKTTKKKKTKQKNKNKQQKHVSAEVKRHMHHQILFLMTSPSVQYYKYVFCFTVMSGEYDKS